MRLAVSQSRARAGIASSVMTCWTAVGGEMSTGPALLKLAGVADERDLARRRDQRPLGDLEAASGKAFLEMHAVGREKEPVDEHRGKLAERLFAGRGQYRSPAGS